ncbi:MAG: YedE family putative selenium transporter [Saccharofermentanales bacterium]|jgi:YedE family putative selenium metabolism protein|nr:YedE family putative selenium transporter [Bacillota bacterium]
MKKKQSLILSVVGLIFGVGAIVLMLQGNPKNMGLCIACFIRDTAGGLHLHGAGVVKYVRPEIIGLILGSFIISLVTREFKTRGGSSPMTRLSIGFLVMVGALVFLGCPMRMVLRMAAGDLNAWIGFVGFVAGVFVGTLFLRMGFSLRRTYDLPALGGYIMPAVQVVFLALLVGAPGLLAFSEEGPGAAKAPIWLALGITLLLGMMVQKTRLCQAGGVRDVLMFNDWALMLGTIGIFVSALIVNLVTGNFNLGMEGQPVAHTESLWNMIGLFVVGLGSILAGGCPMRQLVLTGTGNVDSALTVIGMGLGAAFCHNFKLASSGEGTTPNGRIAVLVAVALLLLLGFANSRRKADV